MTTLLNSDIHNINSAKEKFWILNNDISKVLIKIDRILSEENILEIENHSIINILAILNLDFFNLENNFSEKEKRLFLRYIENISKKIWNYRNSMNNPEKMIIFYEILETKIKSFLNLITENSKEYSIESFKNIFDKLYILKLNILSFSNWYNSRYIFNETPSSYIKDCIVIPSESISNDQEDFDIVFDKNKKWENDYFIDINLSDSNYFIPRVLIEVVRDLVFNSRKYSSKWSDIYLDIKQDNDFLKIVVIDEWLWIPDYDIFKVFELWKRSENAKNKTWNWLWLTKAYYVVDRLNWDILVKTKEWVWTMIEINIPYKKELEW